MGRLTRKIEHLWCVEGVGFAGCVMTCRYSECGDCRISEAFTKLAHYEDLEEQGRLIDGDKLIMSIADWQMTLSPANNEADAFEYNVLESVIEHIAELKELEGAKE